ncbi:MAG: T9SS type A sorting domain-containing protein [Tunicatimonas sp.]
MLALLNSGDEILIRWDLYNSGGDFDWSLAVEASEVGDDCELPASATLGSNTVPTTSISKYWYTFTMPNNGKLHVTPTNSNYVSVYSNTCGSLNYEGGGYGATITTLKSGDQIFIEWETYNGGDFDWNLSTSPLEPGDNCSLAVTATAGTNAFSATTSDYYWYTYTMPSDGKLRLTSSVSNSIQVYGNSCDRLENRGAGPGNVEVTTLNSGDEVYIRWYTKNSNDFNWNLAVLPLETGDNCSLAATADGTNTLPATLSGAYWYTYTMPSDGKLQITSSSSAYVSLYSNTCDDLTYEEEEYENLTFTSLQSGDQVFIKWEFYRTEDFDWNLSVVPFGPGDNCSLPVTATIGSNTTPAAPYWFNFTAPSSGSYTLSSVGSTNKDTYLYVFSDCNLSLLDEDDDDSDSNTLKSKVVLDLAAGETIYILWNNNYSSAAFDWTLSSDAPAKATQAISFGNLTDKTLESAPFNLTATASSGLPVSYTSSDETVATVSGTEVTIVGTGTTTITASQLGDETYAAAEPVARPLTINKVNQTITIDAIADQQVDASPITVVASTTSGLALQYAVSGPATLDGNTITLNGTEGTVRVTVRQSGDDYYRAASASESFIVTDPNLQDQVITFEEIAPKTVDDDEFTLNATSSVDLPITYRSSDETVAVVSADKVTIIGAGSATITASQAGNETYRAASATQALTVTDPRAPTAVDCGNVAVTIIETVHVTCHGAANGSLTASATDGQAPYLYSLDNVTFQETTSFADLDTGTYQVTVQDANECQVTVEATITAPDALSVDGLAEASTESSGNGRIVLNTSGGTAPYRYAWSNATITSTVSNLVMGDYSVTVTDAQGCTVTRSFTVEGVTSVEEQARVKVDVYPNPVHNVMGIDVPFGSKIKGGTFYDPLGKKVIEVNLVEGKNRLDVQTLKPGSYLLKLDNGSSQRVMIW